MAKGGGRWVQPPGVTSMVSMAREDHLCGLCPGCALWALPGLCSKSHSHGGVSPSFSRPLPPGPCGTQDWASHAPGADGKSLSEQLGLVMTCAQRATPLQELSRAQKHLRQSPAPPSISPGLWMVLGPQPADNDRMPADRPADGQSSG